MLLNGENSKLEYDIIIHKKDDVYFQIECERSIAKELNEYFSFEVPGAKFMPSFKNIVMDNFLKPLYSPLKSYWSISICQSKYSPLL